MTDATDAQDHIRDATEKVPDHIIDIAREVHPQPDHIADVSKMVPDATPLWRRIVAIGESVPESEWQGVPPDLSRNLDHYLYGAEHQEPVTREELRAESLRLEAEAKKMDDQFHNILDAFPRLRR